MNDFWFITDENDENTRLDNYLSDLYESFSRSHFKNLIKDGKVFINGEIKKPSYKVRLGDKVEIEIVEEKEKVIVSQNIALDIIWEDENMAVINKPSGMLTHPTELETENTLVNALLYKYGENLSDINGNFRRGILHRLDRNTSGLLMIAKNNQTHEFLASQFKPPNVMLNSSPPLVSEPERGLQGRVSLAMYQHRIIESSSEQLCDPELTSQAKAVAVSFDPVSTTAYVNSGQRITKKYLAIVKSVVKKDSGIINLPIGRNPNQPSKMAVIEDGKPSITEFKVLKRFKDCTYLELDLKTGRTHQIRVHLSHLHHPIINDSLYGGGGLKVKTQEQVLQSYKLSFTKPFSNDIIELEIEPDEKIRKVLKYLGNGK